jgi:PPE-repeat protein
MVGTVAGGAGAPGLPRLGTVAGGGGAPGLPRLGTTAGGAGAPGLPRLGTVAAGGGAPGLPRLGTVTGGGGTGPVAWATRIPSHTSPARIMPITTATAMPPTGERPEAVGPGPGARRD